MNKAVLFVVLTVVIDSIGIGLIIPVLPTLVEEVGGGPLAETAIWLGVLASSFSLMQFLFGPLVGNLSDRFGRKPILVGSLVVLAVDYVIMALAATVWLLLLGRIIAGITAATHSTANAYMADISKPHEKAARFGLLGAAFGIGFVIGPVLGGLLAGFGTRAPFWAAAALAAANAVFGWLVLEETVTDRIRRTFLWRRANPLGAFKEMGRLPGLRGLLAVHFLYQLAFASYSSIWAIYTGTRFGWSEQMIGLSLGLFGVSFAIVSAVLIRPALRWLGERGCIVYGHMGDIAIFILIGAINSGFWLLLLTPLAALPGVITPALQALMSKTVGDDQQGELQGVLTSVTAVAMIPAPMIMTGIFAAFGNPETAPYVPGAPFFLAAALMALALMVFLASQKSEGAAA
jgi:DHA1 family tetracycline resistance protein-like MFS transporter